MNKKTLSIILVVFIILVGLGFFFYWIFSSQGLFKEYNEAKSNNSLPTSSDIFSPQLPSVPTLSPEERSKLTLISTGDIVSFWPIATTTVQYFKLNSGFWQTDYSQLPIDEKPIDTSISFGQVLDVNLSSDRTKALISYIPQRSSEKRFSILDIESREISNLNDNIVAADWSPDSENLIFYYSDSLFGYKEGEVDDQYLGIFDKDLLRETNLLDFHISEDSLISWASSSVAYISQKPSGLIEQTILSLDTKHSTFEPFVSGYGLILKWDRNGNYGLLFSTQEDGSSPTLKLINKEGISLATFPKLTLPEKCTFSRSSPYLYCAVAEDIPSDVVWPDNYFQGEFNNREEIYKINLQSMEAELILEKAAFEIKGIDLSPDESGLIFYDSRSTGLYVLDLSLES